MCLCGLTFLKTKLFVPCQTILERSISTLATAISTFHIQSTFIIIGLRASFSKLEHCTGTKKISKHFIVSQQMKPVILANRFNGTFSVFLYILIKSLLFSFFSVQNFIINYIAKNVRFVSTNQGCQPGPPWSLIVLHSQPQSVCIRAVSTVFKFLKKVFSLPTQSFSPYPLDGRM